MLWKKKNNVIGWVTFSTNVCLWQEGLSWSQGSVTFRLFYTFFSTDDDEEEQYPVALEAFKEWREAFQNVLHIQYNNVRCCLLGFWKEPVPVEQEAFSMTSLAAVRLVVAEHFPDCKKKTTRISTRSGAAQVVNLAEWRKNHQG